MWRRSAVVALFVVTVVVGSRALATTCADCGRVSLGACSCAASCASQRTCKMCCSSQHANTWSWGILGRQSKAVALSVCQGNCITDL